MLAIDVDGVLTDAGMYYSESGDELRKFHTRDGMGIKMLQAVGFVTAVITKEKTAIVERWGRGELLVLMRPRGLTTRSSRLMSVCSTSGIFVGPMFSDIGRSAMHTFWR